MTQDPATGLYLPDGWERWPRHRKESLRQTLRTTRFRRTYRDDPVAFQHDCFRWDDLPRETGPTEYQDEIVADLLAHGRLAVRGPHGLGKTSTAAWLILWFSLTRDGEVDWKMPTTASAWRQLKRFLWPEVHKWARLVDWSKVGRDPFNEPRELQDMALSLGTGEAFAVASDQPAAIEGAHADELFYLYDEAKTIPDDTFDATEGAFSGAGADTGRLALALAMSTPGAPYGRFYEIHKRGRVGWRAKHVKLERAIAAGRVSASWVEERATDWGRGSALFKNRAEGEFAAGSEKSVIPLEWVEAAVERWRDAAVPTLEDEGSPGVHEGLRLPDELLGPMTCVSADVSDQGVDQTVLAIRHGPAIAELRTLPFDPDLMETTGAIAGVLRARTVEGEPPPFAVVDSIGIGAGVKSRLRELKDEGELAGAVVGFDAGAATDATDSTGELGFENRRAEAWWGMRDRLHPSRGDGLLLPPDDEMIADLTTPTWKQTSRSRILIESKDDLRKAERLGRSPDKGDTVVMAFSARPPKRARATGAGRRRLPGAEMPL